MQGIIYMIEVNTTEDVREPEYWVAMNQPCYTLQDAMTKLKREKASKISHDFPRRVAKYGRMEVITAK